MNRCLRPACLLLVLLLFPTVPAGAAGVGVDRPLDDPGQEALVQETARELRCVVCPNQSVSNSDAPLARELREVLREQIRDGASKQEAVSYVVARYGERVLFSPPLSARTWLLWLGPWLALGLGLLWILWKARSSAGQPEPPPLPPPGGAQRRWLDSLEGPPSGQDGR